MNTFLVTFLAFVLTMAAMAVGVIFSNRRIKGSCGGMNGRIRDELGEERCSICGVTAAETEAGACGSPDAAGATS